jgi:gamma-glutamyltranspeptidase/glutathione hydrolase
MRVAVAGLVILALALGGGLALAQSGALPPFGSPTPERPDPSAEITAMRGDRASNWADQTRSEVVARHGMVATSQPLAAQAGLRILQRGGNAADAAIAGAAELALTEPYSTSLGADMFAIYYSAKDRKLYGLNASGGAPKAWTPEYFKSKGYDETTGMPDGGVDTITVPGTIDGWHKLLKRFGTMSFREVLAPAVRDAEQGFGITERIHVDWANEVEKLRGDPDSAQSYLVDGNAPALYSNFRNPDLARALRTLQRQGRDAFYEGDMAKATVKKIQQLGGVMKLSDMKDYEAEWVKPISTDYHGYDVYELPPNGQGFAALEMLNILEVCAPKLGLDLAQLGPRSPQFWHLMVEAKKLAYADLHAHNGDPRFVDIPLDELLSKDYAATLCDKIDPNRASAPASTQAFGGGTIYLAAADRWGNMVSLIYSVYNYFGSGLTVPGYGFLLHDRGNLFSLDPDSPNIVAPGKRPFHTIIPAFVMKDGKPVLAFGNMGGSVQAQAHALEVVNMVDLGMNVQAAGDAARFRHDQDNNRLRLESKLFDVVGPSLAAMGHDVRPSSGDPMGGYQAIHFAPDPNAAAAGERGDDPPVAGVYRAGSDFRKDGQAAGW